MHGRGSTRRGVSVLLVIISSLTPPIHGLFGIPSFLELGSCAEVKFEENFNPLKYSGLWFDIESVPNEYQHTKKCVTQNYTWTGTEMYVATRGLTDDDAKVQQSAVMFEDEYYKNSAAMLVHASGVPEAPYQVLSTDYTTFSCVYSCLDGYAGFMAEFMWVFSRTPTLSDTKIKHCHDIFTGMQTNPQKMVPVIQGNTCPYYKKLDELLITNKKHFTTAFEETEISSSSSSSSAPTTTTTMSSIQTRIEITQNEIDGFKKYNHYDEQEQDMTMPNDNNEGEFNKHKENLKEASLKRMDERNSETDIMDKSAKLESSSSSSARPQDSTSSTTPTTTFTTTFITLALTLPHYIIKKMFK